MAGRDTLIRHAQPLLDEGEWIKRVFPASSGPNPQYGIALLLVGFLLSAFDLFPWSLIVFGAVIAIFSMVRNLVVAVTDRAVIVMASGLFFAFRARHIEERLPADTTLGPMRGLLWANATGLSAAVGKQVLVHRRFHGDVETKA